MVSISKYPLSSLTLIATVLADSPNPISYPGYGTTAYVGDSIDIKWSPESSISAVNLVLMGGKSNNLKRIDTIASGISNTGSYSWSIPSSVGSNSAYAVVIEDAQNPDSANYSTYFTILGSSYKPVSASAPASSSASSNSASTSSDRSSASSSASRSASSSASRTTSSSSSESSSASASSSAGSSLTTSSTSNESRQSSSSALQTGSGASSSPNGAASAAPMFLAGVFALLA